MSKKLVEDIHYNYAQTAKKFKAFDIIDTGKAISVLEGTEKSLVTWAVYGKKEKEIIREALKDITK